ncbi:MAG: metallopeptidase TldD-related protein [Candidatus Hodarchaeota archaeon]
MGFACGTFSAVEATIAQALKNAHQTKSMLQVRFPPPAKDPPKDVTLFDKALLGLETADLFELLQLIETADFSPPSNYSFTCELYRVTENFAILNSNDLVAKEENAWIAANSLIRGKRRWGYAETFTHQLSIDSVIAVGHQALDSIKARPYRGFDPVDRETLVSTAPRFPVIWNYKAIADLLAYSLAPALSRSADQFIDTKEAQSSPIPILSKNISIFDDPHIPYGIGSHQIDQEGVNTEKKTLIERGCLISLLATYFEDAEGSNAYRAQYFSDIERSFEIYPQEMPSNLVLDAPGLECKDLFDLPQGIYIQGVVGVHESFASTGKFSITASESFVIDHGNKNPLRTCHISGNVYNLLNSITAVSQTKELVHPTSAPFAIQTPMIITEGGVSLLIK